jgi:hypothetical protein
MSDLVIEKTRRPRFQRAQPPAFRLTDDDVAIVRLLARHRFLRSTHIAALVERSLDRTNDRLARLFHAGYLDRPRAQLDRFPHGSAPMVYALADRGARLLIERDGVAFANVAWSRKNRDAGRPFLEHQLEIADFQVAVHQAVRQRPDLSLITPEEIIASASEETRRARNPFALKVQLRDHGIVRDVGVVPDWVFGLRFADGSRRCFMVEIDRGTMPVVRTNPALTSFARKMRAYLAAHAAKLHERQFWWKAFRVLTVSTNVHRVNLMRGTLSQLGPRQDIGAGLFLFSTRQHVIQQDPLSAPWMNGHAREVQLT